jgi:hypothetical protein
MKRGFQPIVLSLLRLQWAGRQAIVLCAVLLCGAARITYGVAVRGRGSGHMQQFAREAVATQQGAAAGGFCASCASFGVVFCLLLLTPFCLS